MPAPDASRLQAQLQKWAEGKINLKEVRGYTDEELSSIARTAWFFYCQGHVSEARTLFQGLYAINPADAYFARALGVVEFASGNAAGALAAFDVAARLAPNDAAVYVSRAEVKLAMGQKQAAMEDLRLGARVVAPEDDLREKIVRLSARLENGRAP